MDIPIVSFIKPTFCFSKTLLEWHYFCGSIFELSNYYIFVTSETFELNLEDPLFKKFQF